MNLVKLFTVFFRVGLFTFGGGYSMLPILEREIVDRNNWVTRDELLDYFAISQCVPGIIAINTATLVGHKNHGFLGALSATVGVVTPSLIIIIIIASILNNFMDIPAVAHAFAGIRVAVCALIVSAVIKLFGSSVLRKNKNGKNATESGLIGLIKYNAFPLALCLLSFILVGFLGTSPIYVLIGALIAGLISGVKRGVT